MKLFVIDECLDKVGGAERIMNGLAQSFYKKNIDIEVISETKNRIRPFYDYGDININYLINKDAIITGKMKKKNFLYYFIRIFEKSRRNLLLRIKFKRLVKKINDGDTIVIGRVLVALDFLPVLYKKNINCKIIVRDAINIHFFNERQVKQIKKYFDKLVDFFIVSSEESVKDYKKKLSNSVKIIKIYNPLCIDHENCYNFNNKQIISAGRMDDDQKGFDVLIKSFNIVHKKHPDWKLVIFGDGRRKPIYTSMIKKLKLSDYIDIKNFDKNIVNAFKNKSIFVLCSRYEGYANVLVEALSCSLPSISFNWLTGVEDIIKDELNGKIVKLTNRRGYFNQNTYSEDINNLAVTINSFIENEDKCNYYSKNANKIVSSRKMDTIINQWINIINS